MKHATFPYPHVIWTTILVLLGFYTILSGERFFLIDAVNLVFHEAGHVFLRPFGEFMHFIGGTLFEIGIPLLITVHFALRSQQAGTQFGLWWLSTALYSASVYSADARAQLLPLLGGDAVTHDWFYILSSLDLLAYDQLISSLFLFAALSALAFMVVQCSVHIRMHTQQVTDTI